MIKAILFDLGGVVFTNGTKKFIDFIATTYSLDKAFVKEIIDGPTATLYREAKITRDEFWKRSLHELQIDEDIDTLEEKWIEGYEVIAGTRRLIQELSQRYKVYFLSDNVKDRVEKINTRYHFIDWFEDGVFSHEVGVRKPNPQIYTFVLKKAHVEPEEAVFIDDKAEFLPSAKEMGIHTFLFKSPEKLHADLKKNHLL
ncbi:MAG TPA: HAD family phosphatase [Candidatus Saccharimonadales bacterium]|nr:HAD family phosphatase [Candidatus Saccharimonadales bacterium]